MAVTKTFPPEQIRQAYDAGIRVFGENRVQEFAGKSKAVRDLARAEWHMIGHLQSNKAAKALELFGHIDSLDSVRLARKLNDVASQLNKRISVLIEINVGGEDVKSGVSPDSQELQDLLKAAPERAPWRPLVGIEPQICDAELVTLAVLQALLGFTSEARWLRHARAHLRHLFPYLPGQPGYNKRLRRLAGTVSWLTGVLARDTSW